jgi:sugar phosphate isomerase/epimerase
MLIGLTTSSLLSLRLHEVIRLAAQTGFDGVELACCTPHFTRAHAERDFEAVGDMLRDAGLKLVALHVVTNLTDPYTVDEEVAMASDFIRVARRVGTDCMVITAGRPASLKAMPDKWQNCVTGLRALAADADRRGVRLLLSIQRGTLADSVASVSRLFDQMGGESIDIALDIGHVLAAGGDVRAFAEFFQPRIALVRVQDFAPGAPEEEWMPLGEGQGDFSAFLAFLRASGYDGPLCLACRHLAREVDLQPHVERELLALRRLLQAGERVPMEMDV